MSQTWPAEYHQNWGETTSTSDLDTLKQTKLFQPVEQAYLKAFIKITRQKTKADHHHLVLNEALRIECPPRGLTPNIRHNIPKPPADLIIKWNQTLFNTATKLTELLSQYWTNQKEELDLEFERLKAELHKKITITPERWLEFTEILENISSTVSQELKRKKYQRQELQQNQLRPIKQASKVRIMNQSSEALAAIRTASPNQSTLLYTPELLPQREQKQQDTSLSQPTSSTSANTN